MSLQPGEIEELRGLTDGEKRELLALLELRDRLEAEGPADDRVPIADYLDRVRQECAAKAPDPDAWMAADAAHQAAADRHCARLLAEHDATTDDVGAWLCAFSQVHAEARALAIADGFPDPDSAVKREAREPEPDLPERSKLPRATRMDIEQSQAKERAEDARIAAEDKRIAELLKKAGVDDAG